MKNIILFALIIGLAAATFGKDLIQNHSTKTLTSAELKALVAAVRQQGVAVATVPVTTNNLGSVTLLPTRGGTNYTLVVNYKADTKSRTNISPGGLVNVRTAIQTPPPWKAEITRGKTSQLFDLAFGNLGTNSPRLTLDNFHVIRLAQETNGSAWVIRAAGK